MGAHPRDLEVPEVRDVNEAVCRKVCSTNEAGNAECLVCPFDLFAEYPRTTVPPLHVGRFAFRNRPQSVQRIRAMVDIIHSCLAGDEVLDER